MKVTHIKTNGFRKFKDTFETKLYDITNITGGNAKGKTNILYAIIWAFLGSNITGDDKVWLGNKNSDNCKVELKFIDNNGRKHNLIRFRHKYNNKKNYILLDDKEVENKDLVSFFNDKKLFLSIISPTYFINKKTTEQKELIDKYLPEVDMKYVYDKLDDTDKKYLEGVPTNITDYIKDLNSDIKMYDNNIKNLRGKIEYARTYADQEIEAKQVFERQEELDLTEQELEHLLKEQSNPGQTNQKHIVNHLEKELENTEQEIKDLEIEMMTGKKTYLAIKAEEMCYCPMCNQAIQDESKSRTIANMNKELTDLFNKKNKLEKDASDLKSRIMVEKCKLHTFDNISLNIKDIKQEIEKAKKIINDLKLEQVAIEQHNAKVESAIKNKNGAKSDIEVFEKQIDEYKTAKENTDTAKKIAQKLFINYIEEKMKYAKNYLKNVDIRYYTVLKESGELKDDFIITYKGNEFKNLSKSETLATSVELRNMFNEISGSKIPLFIDDTESCADFDFIQTVSQNNQVIISKVEKAQELQITNYEQNELLQAA